MPSHMKITALLTARPGRAEELEALLRRMAPDARAETGNRRWDVWRIAELADRTALVLSPLLVERAIIDNDR